METMREREDRVMDLSADSAFYKNEDGVFRIQYTDTSEGTILVLDENSGEEYQIEVADVKDTDSFYVSKEVIVGERKPTLEDVVLALRKLYDYDTQCATPAEAGTYEAEVLAKCKQILDQF